MKHPAFLLLAVSTLAALPLRANDYAIANCNPSDAFITLYSSIDTFELAARLPCGVQVDLLESQKTYAAQHTPFVRVATEDGKQGYVSRSVLTVYRSSSVA